MCAVVFLHTAVSILARRSFPLTAFGDLLQNTILFAATVAFMLNIRTGGRRARLFWALMSLGLGMWLISQVMWTYFEIYLRHEAPNPFVGDVILFLHIVPMMAAVALQPHVQRDDRTIRVGTLDFALLLTWWLFLYLFVVIPWQYIHPTEALYGKSFDSLYVSEELVLAADGSSAADADAGARTNTKRPATSRVPETDTARFDERIIFAPSQPLLREMMRTRSLKPKLRTHPSVLDTVLQCSSGRGDRL